MGKGSKRSATDAPSFLPILIVYHAVNDGMLACISALFPVLRALEDSDFGLTYENIGIVTSAGLIVTVVFQILAGRVGDVRNPQYLMAGGIFMLGLTSILVTQAYDFITLFSILLLLRVGAAFYHPIGIGWISKKFTGQNLDRSMGYQSALGDAGVMIAFLTTGFIAINWGWRIPLIIWGVANMGSVIIGIAIRYDVATPKAPSRTKDPDASTVKALYKGFRFSLLPLAVTGAAYTITTNFGPLLVTDGLGQTPDIAGLVIAIWIGAGVVSASTYGKISSIMGRQTILVLSFLLISIACFVIGIFNEPEHLWLVCVMMAIFGFFLFITWPALFSMISDATGKVSQGFIFSIIFAGQIIGGATLAYIAGLVAEVHGIGSPFLILAMVLFLPVITLMFHKEGPKLETKGPELN